LCGRVLVLTKKKPLDYRSALLPTNKEILKNRITGMVDLLVYLTIEISETSFVKGTPTWRR
jgi:hypothetical protein